MKSKKYFTIYNNSTDDIVASGFLEECAEQMKTNPRCMSSIISKAIHGKRKKYTVVVEEINTQEIENN